MINPYEIKLYRTASGKKPYTEWEKSLDKATAARIDAREFILVCKKKFS